MTVIFPDLLKTHGHVIQKALNVGKLDAGQYYFELPDDFDFEGKPPVAVNISLTPKRETKPIVVEWPLLLRPLKALAKEGDRGLGDIVKHLIGDDNSEAFKKWFVEHFHTSCGCTARQDYLNRNFPL